MPRKPEIGTVQLYPDRPLRKSDRNGYVLKFYCPIRGKRIRKNCGTRDKRVARRIQRECRERLLSGEYAASGGAVTEAEELASPQLQLVSRLPQEDEMTWDAAFEQYRNQKAHRRRRKSSQDSDSRVDIAGRVFEARRANAGQPPGATLRECTTLAALEWLQVELLDGAESKYDVRSPNTVNSMMGAVMAFVRYCCDHEWIGRVPPIRDLEVDEVMRGRPITLEEFERMLAVVPKVVGERPAESWRFSLRVLWESGFRIGDLMNFSWDDDDQRIHPVWPGRRNEHATIILPSTQKNRKVEEIPMLPGLRKLLEEVTEDRRTGFVVDPRPIEYALRSQKEWFQPRPEDLAMLIREYSNLSIARACGVSEQTVRNWLDRLVLQRHDKIARYGQDVPADLVERLRKRAARRRHQRSGKRLTSSRVSEIIAAIGKEAKVIVRQADPETGRRIKYASAHDLRRSLAERMINAGVSAETLMVIMRHKDFATTLKHYGGRRGAQSAAAEVHQRLVLDPENRALVGGLVGGKEEAPRLDAEELRKLKALLAEL